MAYRAVFVRLLAFMVFAFWLSQPASAQEADLAITKNAPATAIAGETLIYQLEVENLSTVTYGFEPIAYSFDDISATGTAVSLSDDEVSGAIPLPFPFPFYGVPQNQLFISSNGFVAFTAGTSDGCCTGQPLPQDDGIDHLISLYWEDLDPVEVAGQIDYQTLGAAPNQRFIVQYTDVEHHPLGNPVTAQIVLFEADDTIELRYLSAPSDGQDHSIGVENIDGTVGTQIAFGDVSFATEAFRLSPVDAFTSVDVSIIDNLPAGVTLVGTTGCANDPTGVPNCELADLDPGQSSQVEIEVQIDPGFTGDLVNDAEVSSVTTDPDTSNNTDSATTVVSAEADLELTKSGPASAIAGTSVTYTLDVVNNGPSDAVSVSLDDTPPAGFTFDSATAPCAGGFPCDLGTLVAGASASVDVTFAIDSDLAPGDVMNSASVNTTTTDPDAANNTSMVTTGISAEADLEVTKTGPAAATAGGSVTYVLQVSNNGPSDAAAVSLDDTPPAGFTFDSATAPCAGGFPCDLGDLGVGSAASVDVTFTIDPAASGSLENVATVSSATADPVDANNTSAATTTIGAEADLEIVKSANTSSVPQGGSLIYTLDVSNAGPSDAMNVVITDVLPQGQSLIASTGCIEDPAGVPNCSVGTVAAGNSVSVTLEVEVRRANGLQENTASVSSDSVDSNGVNNASSVLIVTTQMIPTLNMLGLALMILTLLGLGLWRYRAIRA